MQKQLLNWSQLAWHPPNHRQDTGRRCRSQTPTAVAKDQNENLKKNNGGCLSHKPRMKASKKKKQTKTHQHNNYVTCLHKLYLAPYNLKFKRNASTPVSPCGSQLSQDCHFFVWIPDINRKTPLKSLVLHGAYGHVEGKNTANQFPPW